MCTLDEFNIDVGRLGQSAVEADYLLDDSYFKAIGGSSDAKSGDVKAHVRCHKTAAGCSVDMHVEGTVTVSCDRCLDDMQLQISGSNTLTVKFVDDYNGTEPMYDGETMTVNPDDAVINIAWPLYETIALAIPARHVHDEGQCNEGMRKALDRYMDDSRNGDESRRQTDHRWDALLNIKTSDEQ